MKMVEELQRRHQQEVERLLVERDRLLEEESAATATGEGNRFQQGVGGETKTQRSLIFRCETLMTLL